MPDRESQTPQTRGAAYEVLLLVALVTALTLGAAWLYPIWDDARLIALIERHGPDAIQWSFGFRPLAAFVFALLHKHQLFKPVSLFAHWLGWLGMGLVTMRIWKMMFAEYARFALLPALLSIAPVLCKIQLVTFTVVFICLLGPVLGYIGILLLLSDQASLLRKLIFAIAGLALIAFSILISEYGMVTAAVGFVLLAAKAIRVNRERKREASILATLLGVCAAASYLIFLGIGSGSNPGFLPGFALQFFSWKIRVIPFRLISGFWRGALGAVLESLGSVTLNSKPALLSFACGAVLGGIVLAVTWHKRDAGAELRQNWSSVVTLSVATVVALIPFLLMDRTLDSRQDSRFFLPLLPVVSSLTVVILLSLLRRRFWILLPVLCGFLAGYSTSFEIASAVQRSQANSETPQSVKQQLPASSSRHNDL